MVVSICDLRVGFHASVKSCYWKEWTNTQMDLYRGGVIYNTKDI